MTREQKVAKAIKFLGSRYVFAKKNMSVYKMPLNPIPNASRGAAIYTSRKLVTWGLI